MPVWAWALVGFGAIVLYKFLSNLTYFISTRRYHDLYTKYIFNDIGNISTYQASIEKLFSRAGAEAGVHVAEPIGWGELVSFTAEASKNLRSRREDMVSANLQSFGRAASTYRMRMFESFSPLYWAESIIFLPKKLLKYLGASGDSALVKIVQVLYWILAPALLLFREQVNNWIVGLLQ